MFKLIHLALSTWRRTFLLAVLLWLISLALGEVTLDLAHFGAPLPIFLFLFGWMVTLGLPTSLAVALVTSLWPNDLVTSLWPNYFFEVFLIVVASIALTFHFVCLWIVRKVIISWWGEKL